MSAAIFFKFLIIAKHPFVKVWIMKNSQQRLHIHYKANALIIYTQKPCNALIPVNHTDFRSKRNAEILPLAREEKSISLVQMQPLTVFVLPEQVARGIFTPMFAYLYSEIIKYFYMQSM